MKMCQVAIGSNIVNIYTRRPFVVKYIEMSSYVMNVCTVCELDAIQPDGAIAHFILNIDDEHVQEQPRKYLHSMFN